MATLIYNDQLGQYWNPNTNNFMQFGYVPSAQDEVLTQSQYDQKYVVPSSPNFGGLDYQGQRMARLGAQGYTQFAGDPNDEYYGYHPERGWEVVGDFKAPAGNAFKEFLTMSALALGGAYLGGLAGLGGSGTGAGAGAAEGAAAAGAAGGAAANTGGVLAGAGDMFGSGAVYDAGVANLAAGGAGAGGGVLAGSGDMFGSGAVYDQGVANLAVPATTGSAAGVQAAGSGGGGAAGGAAGITSFADLASNPQVLGLAGGALLGSLGGGGEAGKIQTEEGLPDWLMPYARPALDQYASQLQNYNTDPYGIMPSAMKEYQNTVSGMYLDPATNKYLEDYYKLGAERIKSSLSPTFGHMQAFGANSGYNEALSRGLGDFATGLYGGNYAKERDRQTQLTAGAPQFLAQSSTQAFTPYQQYLSTVAGLGKKKEEPYFTNPFGNILGGAMVGSQLGSVWK